MTKTIQLLNYGSAIAWEAPTTQVAALHGGTWRCFTVLNGIWMGTYKENYGK